MRASRPDKDGSVCPASVLRRESLEKEHLTPRLGEGRCPPARARFRCFARNLVTGPRYVARPKSLRHISRSNSKGYPPAPARFIKFATQGVSHLARRLRMDTHRRVRFQGAADERHVLKRSFFG